MTVLNDIWNVVVSNQGIILLAILASFAVIYAKRNGKLPGWAVSLTIDIFEFVEQEAEKNSIKGADKMALFLSEFVKRYNAENQDIPIQEIIALVVQLVEVMVAEQNKDKVDPADIQ